MDNVITMRLKDEEQKEITFESNPTVYELVAAKLILEEVLERNFHKSEILHATANIYDRLENVEEVIR